MGICSKSVYKQALNTHTTSQHAYSSKNCKSKAKWAATSHLSGGPYSKRPEHVRLKKQRPWNPRTLLTGLHFHSLFRKRVLQVHMSHRQTRKSNAIRCSHKNQYKNIHSNIIHNSQEAETTQMPKIQCSIYLHNGISSSNQDRGSTDTFYNKEEL